MYPFGTRAHASFFSLTGLVLENSRGRRSLDVLHLRAIVLVAYSADSRAGDGPDGRRQIGSTPAGGVGDARASRGRPRLSLQCRPDEGTTAPLRQTAPSPGEAGTRNGQGRALPARPIRSSRRHRPRRLHPHRCGSHCSTLARCGRLLLSPPVPAGKRGPASNPLRAGAHAKERTWPARCRGADCWQSGGPAMTAQASSASSDGTGPRLSRLRLRLPTERTRPMLERGGPQPFSQGARTAPRSALVWAYENLSCAAPRAAW